MESKQAAAAVVPDLSLSTWIEDRLLPLREVDEQQQRTAIAEWWRTLPYRECFILNKLLTGELRVGVSELLVTRALSEVLRIERADVTRRIMGEWKPSAQFWQGLQSTAPPTSDPAAPYPFFLASPLEGEPTTLGPITQWQSEWKWDLYTDYTFGVWSNDELVPVAKAYSGLSNTEIVALDRWIRAHTTEKFGPVRQVERTQVFELAYEGIAASKRHKSGIALRFPRILRRRTDKPATDADKLSDLQAVLLAHGQAAQADAEEEEVPPDHAAGGGPT